MRTIPRTLRRIVRGDRRAQCAYCDGVYYRSRMTRDADGFLRCPDRDCARGRTAGELDRANAREAQRAAATSKRRADW